MVFPQLQKWTEKQGQEAGYCNPTFVALLNVIWQDSLHSWLEMQGCYCRRLLTQRFPPIRHDLTLLGREQQQTKRNSVGLVWFGLPFLQYLRLFCWYIHVPLFLSFFQFIAKNDHRYNLLIQQGYYVKLPGLNIL
jgi:hypothetical protein